MALMSPLDSMFLIGESREQPMHVGSLQVFELPDGADTELLRNTLQDLLPQATIQAVAEMAQLTPRVLRLAEQSMRAQAATLPGQAPRSMLNTSITGSRRYAAQSYSIERMRLVAKGAGVTLNDVLLAMSAGALRSYLLEQTALPNAPLTAMT